MLFAELTIEAPPTEELVQDEEQEEKDRGACTIQVFGEEDEPSPDSERS